MLNTFMKENVILEMARLREIWSIKSLLSPNSEIHGYSVPQLNTYASRVEPAEHVSPKKFSKKLSLGSVVES